MKTIQVKQSVFWTGGKMKKIGRIVTFALLLAGLWGCSQSGSAEKVTVEEKAIPVRTMPLVPHTFEEYLQITGTVKARNQVDLLAEEGGVLKRVLRDKGSRVRAGDTLAVLDNPVLVAAFHEAEAALHQAELTYRSNQVMYGKKAISENDYLASKYALERARANFALMKARYEKLFLKAPFEGYVNERYVDLGAYVRPLQPVFQVIDNAWIKIRAGVAERFMNDIRVGTPVQVTFDALPDLVLEGKISFVSRAMDPVARTFTVEIEMPNPDRKLAPEMVANLKILRRRYQDHLVVPLDAVIENEQGSFVYVVENNRARRLPVKLLSIYADSAVVEGLQPHMDLIVVGQHEVSDGDLVSIVSGTES
ncbi:MAG: efflux RND transporter periplasmic adaptor subunit [Calditrichaeota bacterium]|nr:MAG: efflux RND transporter periplasmic adaptor subunit [Calditrichota bacterium]